MTAILTFFLPALLLLSPAPPVPSPATLAPPPSPYYEASADALVLPAITPLRVEFSETIDRSA